MHWHWHTTCFTSWTQPENTPPIPQLYHQLLHCTSCPRCLLLISLSKQYKREPLYFHIPNISHRCGLIATHCTDAVPPAAYVSLRDRSLMLHVQVTLFAQYYFNAGQSFRNLGHFQQFRQCLIKPATIHVQRRSQNLVKPAPPL